MGVGVKSGLRVGMRVRPRVGFGSGSRVGAGVRVRNVVPRHKPNAAALRNPNLSHNPKNNIYTDCVCSKFHLAKCDVIGVVYTAI